MSHSRMRVYPALLIAIAAVAVMASDFEAPPVLSAGEILPAGVVEGGRYHVEAEVENDGYMNTYRIASDFGRFEAYGSTRLALLVREIEALGELDELSKTEVYAKALKDGALSSVRAIEAFAERPVDTVKGVPKGVKKLFGRTKRSVESGYQAAKSVVTDEKDGSEGEGAAGEGEGAAGEVAEEDKSRAEEAGEFAKDYGQKYFGVNAAQRRWSQKLGVDPYTSNKVLKQAIKQVAKVDSAGRFTVRLAPIPKIPGASTIAKANSLVWTMDAYELVQFNRKRLATAGAEAEAIDAFYQNAHFSPTGQTMLITSLLSLEATENIGQALTQASTAESDDEAHFFVTSARMLEWFHGNESPIVRLLPGVRAFVAASGDGRVVLHAPVDYLSWTAEIADAASRLSDTASAAGGRRELWLLGDASPRCRAELEALGWTLETGVGTRLYEAVQSVAEDGGEG